jgi:hypothetical protein
LNRLYIDHVCTAKVRWLGVSLLISLCLKVEEPILDTLRFRATKESELDMNFFW